MTRLVLAASLAVSALFVAPAQADLGRPCVYGWCVGDDLPCIWSDGGSISIRPCPSQ